MRRELASFEVPGPTLQYFYNRARAITRIHSTEEDCYRFLVSRLPVVRNPLSPIALRHSIESCPSVARPSRFMSFCKASRPSCWPTSCSTRNATWRTSRGFMVGFCGFSESGRSKSQLRDRDLNGGFGFNIVFWKGIS